MTLRQLAGLAALTLVVGCSSIERATHPYDPLGWPSRGIEWVGDGAARTDVPVVRELGRLLTSVGGLLRSPALLVEGAVTADPARLVGSGEMLVAGSGATVTSVWNVPWFWVPGGTVDLGRDAEVVQSALDHLASRTPEQLRYREGDPREIAFPPGTTVRAEGKHLVYTIPGYGEVLQTAESNWLWSGLQGMLSMNFPAQERSWGFIVRTGDRWDAYGPRQRAITILHELYHQQAQMRIWLRGWTSIYWPAYFATYPFTGWSKHWAEVEGHHAAYIVNHGLLNWAP